MVVNMKKILGLVFLLINFISMAAEGVLEINQTCAAQLGCFSGDTPGFPVHIDGASGLSYRLTSDLIIPDTNTAGIILKSPNISIDMNGFAIIGLACVGATTDCKPASGFGIGISIDTSNGNVTDISISNGKVIGMGLNGISVFQERSNVDHVFSKWNRNIGISVGANGKISNSTSFENGGNGIVYSSNAIIENNVSTNNGGRGISGQSYAIIRGNITNNNSTDGIIAQGIGCVISNNTSNNNGADGIECTRNCLVKNNTISSNMGFGLNIFNNTAYKDNVLLNNTSDVNGGINTGGNICGNAICL
jgi:hypothetical protein